MMDLILRRAVDSAVAALAQYRSAEDDLTKANNEEAYRQKEAYRARAAWSEAHKALLEALENANK